MFTRPHFAALACKTDEAVDGKPTDHRLKQVAVTDEVLHKISGNEHREILLPRGL